MDADRRGWDTAAMRVELHCHSTFSDGSETAEAVGRAAAARGVELFCLTDHDTCAGTAEARRGFGDGALRGVELSCIEEGRTVHVLIYDCGGDWVPVERALEAQGRARRERVHAISERLANLGAPVDAEAILAGAVGRSVGRPDMARALVDAGHVRSASEAFDRYLRDGGPADVPVARTSVADGLALARDAGARASLAHPDVLGPLAARILRRHRTAGLDAVEAFYGMYDRRERDRWLALAAELDLVSTGGSDFHGTALPKVKRVGVDLPEPHAARLLAWLGR